MRIYQKCYVCHEEFIRRTTRAIDGEYRKICYQCNRLILPRGVKPYPDAIWGHIELLEGEYGLKWKDAIKQTNMWPRLSSGENIKPNTGSINWAIWVAFQQSIINKGE